MYNFTEDLSLTVNGRFITGFAEDGLTWEKTEDNIEMNVGAQGEVLTNTHYNPTGQMTIRLKANSPSITYLNQLANSKRPVAVHGRRTGALNESAGGNKGYVQRPASASFGRNAENREFIVVIEDFYQR